MGFAVEVSLPLGAGNAGLTDLRAQPVDGSGVGVGSAVASGFVEIGGGNYLWTYSSFPDGYRWCKFYSNAAPSTVLAFGDVTEPAASGPSGSPAAPSTTSQNGMGTYSFPFDSTGKSILVHVRDSTTGLGKTDLVFNSAGLVVAYTRERSVPVSVPLVSLASPTAAWASGGFVETSKSLKPGQYRVDLPDAALASGAAYFTVGLKCPGVLDDEVLVGLESANSSGSGAIAHTHTVTNANTGLPVQGVDVWVTSDPGGFTVVAGTLQTDSRGQVKFYLDAGTYYVWAAESGYTAVNPTTITVS